MRFLKALRTRNNTLENNSAEGLHFSVFHVFIQPFHGRPQLQLGSSCHVRKYMYFLQLSESTYKKGGGGGGGGVPVHTKPQNLTHS